MTIPLEPCKTDQGHKMKREFSGSARHLFSFTHNLLILIWPTKEDAKRSDLFQLMLPWSITCLRLHVLHTLGLSTFIQSTRVLCSKFPNMFDKTRLLFPAERWWLGNPPTGGNIYPNGEEAHELPADPVAQHPWAGNQSPLKIHPPGLSPRPTRQKCHGQRTHAERTECGKSARLQAPKQEP